MIGFPHGVPTERSDDIQADARLWLTYQEHGLPPAQWEMLRMMLSRKPGYLSDVIQEAARFESGTGNDHANSP